MPTAEGGEIALDQKGAPMLFVFKTLIDQYGKNSFFKVLLRGCDLRPDPDGDPHRQQ